MRNYSGKWWMVIIPALILAFVSACGVDETNNKTIEEGGFIIPKTTKVIDDALNQDLSQISYDGSLITFFGYSQISKDIKVGDVLVSGVTEATPFGLLRKVSHIGKDFYYNIIVSTVPATLEEAIETGTIEINQELGPNDIASIASIKKRNGYLNPQGRYPNEFYIDFNNVQDWYNMYSRDEIALNGSIEFTQAIEFKVIIKNHKITEVTFANTVKEFIDLGVDLNVDLLDYKYKTVVPGASWMLKPIVFMAGFVPVVVVPMISVNVGFDIPIGISVATGITQEAIYSAGLQYTDSSWEPIQDFSNNFTFISPTPSASCDIKGYAGPQLDILLYGLAGPYVLPRGYLLLGADIFRTPWWQLYGGLEVAAGFKISALSLNIMDHEFPELIGYQTLLAEANTPTPAIPDTPSNLQATAISSSEIDLSWTDNTNIEDGFKIERKAGSGGTYTQIGTVSANVTSYKDTGLICETTYYYRIRAYGVNDSSYTSEKGATTATCPVLLPSAPSDLQGTAVFSSQINISWIDNSDNEDGFKIEMKTVSSGIYSQVGSVATGITVYYATGLTCETTYYFQVRAYNNAGDSDYSNEFSATMGLCAPTKLQATAVSLSEIDLSWTDNTNIEDGFKIERKAGSGGTYTQIGTVSANVTSYKDTGLTCETTYYYRIRAYGVNDSDFSNEVSAETGSNCIPAPSNLSAIVVSSSQIDLSWDCNSNGIDGYNIYRKIGQEGTYENIENFVKVNSLSDSELLCDTNYYYQVRSYHMYNIFYSESLFNEEINIILSCPSYIPTAPSNLQLTVVSSTQINISWVDNSDNEDTFDIYLRYGFYGEDYRTGSVGANTTFYPKTDLSCNTLYGFHVVAHNGLGSSSSNELYAYTSACASSIPSSPSGLSAYAVSQSQINLSWIDNSSNENGFKIERKTGSGGSYSLINTTSSNTTSYSNTGLSANTTYYYRVYAYNSNGNSGYSNEVNATTQSSALLIQWASISAGCLNMGDAFSEGSADELPVHNVCLSSFQISKYEVTNSQYKACVDAAVCSAPSNNSSDSRTSYYGNTDYDNYPVIYVNWNQASSYCAWVSGRLPTEAEWEFAARGGLADKRHPWGDSDLTCTFGASNGAQYSSCSPNDTVSVGSFGSNGYGLYDMTGNVSEWIHDWYSSGYYSSSPTNDPQGPSSGSYRVIRGGDYGMFAAELRVSCRDYFDPVSSYHYFGFRCAK